MPPFPDTGIMDRLNAALTGRYRLERELGRGGTATVYLADDLRNDRKVAIKIIRPELAHAVVADRFLREIRIEARLTHPNIIALLDSGVLELADGPPRPFYVMPFVPGESLRQRLDREGSLPVEDSIRLVLEVAAALDYAHQEGVIHRDIKPENILLVAGHAVISDFGIARLLSSSGAASATSGALALGTPHYMSPEQWAADPHLDGRCDQYSLACVLYEALTGEPPFTGPTVDAVRARHNSEVARPIHTVRKGVPDHVVSAVARAMAKVPADRFRSVAEMAAALQAPGMQPRPAPLHPRGILVGIVLLTLVVSVVLWFFVLRRADPTVRANRFLVLAFRDLEGTGGPHPIGEMIADRVRMALDHWEDVTVVPRLQLADVLGREPRPVTVSDGVALARTLEAGNMIWGTLEVRGDTTWIDAELYDVAGWERRGAHVRTRRVALVDGVFSDQFSELVADLVAGAAGLPARRSVPAGTRSFAALAAYISGDSALGVWNLPLAEERLRDALEHDRQYPQANLRYAEVLRWRSWSRPAHPAEWRRYVEVALQREDLLTVPEGLHARALQAQADEHYPLACEHYRQLLKRDDLDFRAWFGLGECLARDPEVVPNPASPSRWSFRSSQRAAMEAFTRALSLVPSIHRAYQGPAFDSLATLFYVRPNVWRPGRSSGPDGARFVAYPSLDADTLAFIPWPYEEVADVRLPGRVHDTREAAIDRNLAALRDIAEFWIAQYPESAPALRLWATTLEISGDLAQVPARRPAALTAASRVRELASGPAGEAEAAVIEVRLLAKLLRFHAARALADSLLAGEPGPLPERRLAGLAALTGRAREAVRLSQASSQWPSLPGGRPMPGALRATAQHLLVYSAMGFPAESLRAIERQLVAEVDRHARPRERQAILEQLLRDPSLYAWDVLDHVVPTGYLDRAIAGARRGDTAAVRAAFVVLDSTRAGTRPGGVAIFMAYQEARLQLAIGDSSGAFVRLAEAIELLPAQSQRLVDLVPFAAAVGRTLVLGAALAQKRGDGARARAWARGVIDLWAGADPELIPAVDSLRRLTGL